MLKVAHSILDVEKSLLDSASALGCWNFYAALEKSESLSLQNGWSPRYLTYQLEDKSVGFIPAFLRASSGDDFSYDLEISKAYTEKTKKPYYPKLQICIPFMPIEGSKFYFSGKIDFLEELIEWARHEFVSSIHITLPDSSEYQTLEKAGFIPSQQFLCYWKNKNYGSFQDFMNDLKSKYRSQIQQERKTVKEKGYTTESITSQAITPEFIDVFYDLFESTHNRKGWVMSKLTRSFFHEFAKSNPKDMVLFLIRRNGNIEAASCHFLQNKLFCGRFWGSSHDEDFLHFEVMYYAPIEYCIQHQIPTMEIGFEKQHKVIRGYVPQTVRTFHYFLDPTFQSELKKYIPVKSPSDKNIFK